MKESFIIIDVILASVLIVCAYFERLWRGGRKYCVLNEVGN